jgi:RNA polymerase sigma factor (sigma-70 family)
MDQDKLNREVGPSLDWVDKIYQEHGSFIESVIRFNAGNSQECQDIYQEVFMALLTKGELGEINDIRNYIYVLTVNKVNEYRQKQIRGKQILKNYAQVLATAPAQESHDPALLREEADKMLETIETCLSEKESQAVLLRYRHMVENEQAAQTMNVTKATFLRYVSVGVKKIRAIVKSSQQVEE